MEINYFLHNVQKITGKKKKKKQLYNLFCSNVFHTLDTLPPGFICDQQTMKTNNGQRLFCSVIFCVVFFIFFKKK